MTDKECVQEIETEKAMMVSASTGGVPIKHANFEYIQRRERIHQHLDALGILDPNPYSDLWAWHGKWSAGELPTYRSRREYLKELFEPGIEALTRQVSGIPAMLEPARTGWARVDRGLEGIRSRMETAKNEEDFQTVGLLCRESLISLGQAVFEQAKHVTSDGVVPSPTDGYRMIEAFISYELSGGSHEEIRAHAKTALKLASALVHRRTATIRDAALCAEATRTMSNMISIIAGRV
jgi:hypothetical protein